MEPFVSLNPSIERGPGRRPRDVDISATRVVPSAVRYGLDTRADVERRRRTGELIRVRPGVYLPAPRAPGPARQREAELLAEVRGVAERFTTSYWFSHGTAALLWGCWTWRLALEVHVTQLGNPSVRRTRDPVLRRHWTELPTRDRAEVDGLPITSLERTVVDCARSLRLPGALVIADSAARRGADPRVMAQILDESKGKRGVRQARRVVELADGRSESPGETLVRLAAIDGGLPALDLQIAVRTWRHEYWLDAGWRDVKVGIEFDGAMKYSGGEYGDPRERLLAEKRREDALREEGWLLIRVTWDDLGDLEGLANRMRAIRRRAFARLPAR